MGVTDCCSHINFSLTLWILDWRTGTLQVACRAGSYTKCKNKTPSYQEVTFLNSISLMITYCFPESTPKLFKRNSLSPCALRFACAHSVLKVHLISFFWLWEENDNKGVFGRLSVCLFERVAFVCMGEEEIIRIVS